MINDFLTNHGGVLGAVLYLLTLVLEAYLGKVRPLGAPSILRLLSVFPAYILSFFRKGDPVTIQNQTAPVAKETKDVIDAALALIRDYKAGLKPADIFAKDFQLLIVAATDSDQIPSERTANPDAFAATVGAGVGQIINLLLGPAKA